MVRVEPLAASNRNTAITTIHPLAHARVAQLANQLGKRGNVCFLFISLLFTELLHIRLSEPALHKSCHLQCSCMQFEKQQGSQLVLATCIFDLSFVKSSLTHGINFPRRT